VRVISTIFMTREHAGKRWHYWGICYCNA